MELHRAMTTYDYIIVGSGSAGGTLAARLSADASISILLLEAGKASHPYSRFPISFGWFLARPDANWLYESEPEAGTNNRRIPVPRGKILGGSSAINGLVWARGQKLDYDTWAQMGARGWSWSDVAPIFDRIETFADKGATGRGKSGPIKVMEVADQNPLYNAWQKGAQEAGFNIARDYNGENQEGIAKAQANIADGFRNSIGRTYLKDAKRLPNLRIETEAFARRLVFDGNRCTGVVYEQRGQTVEARAGREVIVSAGSVATPQLLELSGIGNPDILRNFGISVRHALPAVGENLRDHINARIQWRSINSDVSYNHLASGLGALTQVFKFLTTRTGFFSLPSAPILAFLKTRPELATPDVQMHFAPYGIKDPVRRKLYDFPSFTIAVYQLRPESLGSIHIRSANPDIHPAIKFNFLANPIDRRTMVDGFKIVRRIAETPAMAQFKGDEFSPGVKIATDEDIIEYIRNTAQTSYHSMGTCRMGPKGPQTVVDENLRVHGLSGLRVADASIFPTMPSGNTNAPSILVGEKAADLLRAT
jgi:choline dehydrogenase